MIKQTGNRKSSSTKTGRMVVLYLLLSTALLIAGCGNSDENRVTSQSAVTDESIEPIKNVTPVVSPDPTQTAVSISESTPEPTTDVTPEPTSAIDKDAIRSHLTILQDPVMYSYANMKDDTETLLQLYPDLIIADSIGTTADGRDIVHFLVGNPKAERQIFINGAIHAREYLTFQLVMKQMCVYLEHVDQNDSWNGISYKDMWESVAIHVVPLINPDGVQISQSGLDGIQNDNVKAGIYQLASNDGCEVTTSYLDHWKANAEGVDLNRNFDAYWENYEGTGYPSSDHYKGTAPGSSPEAAALIHLTEKNNFLYTISYHTQGRVIYWNFENIDPIYDISIQWINKISAQTGYSPINDFSTVDPAGYSDWAIYRKQIPSIVIEVAYGESPYLADQFQQVWTENQNIWEITIQEALNR